MHAWVSGIGYSSLALASLVGLGGRSIEPNAAARPQQAATAIRIVPDSKAHQKDAALLSLVALSRGEEDVAPTLRQTYEDIEIYRRLLAKSLAPFTTGNQSPNLAAQSIFIRLPNQNEGTSRQLFERLGTLDKADPHANLEHPSLRVDGVYLPQGGIVFTADVTGKLTLPVAKKSESKAKQLTDWDRMRRELQGEKVEAAVPNARLEQPHVVDTVLHSLAENGQHLSGLTADQNVAVVLTFRTGWTQQCQQCHTSAKGVTLDASTTGTPATSITTDTFFPAGKLSTATGQAIDRLSTPNASGTWAAQAPVSDSLLALALLQSQNHSYAPAPNDQAILGDLHFKQGRYDEAVAAYRKSLKEVVAAHAQQEVLSNGDQEGGRKPTVENPRVRILVLKSIELQNRIIQCEVALKHDDLVKQGVARLKNLMSALEQIEKNPKSSDAKKGKARGPALPEKLIVVASKALLDRVGKKEINFEDFKAQVRVEYLKFDSSEK